MLVRPGLRWHDIPRWEREREREKSDERERGRGNKVMDRMGKWENERVDDRNAVARCCTPERRRERGYALPQSH